MKILVLGTPDDVRGFALAGAAGRVPRDAEEVEQAIEEAERDGVELILLSPEIARLAPEAVAASRVLVVILPEGGADADAGERRGDGGGAA
jgi:vacuolar-type H+-ATPase subunit F/Vma7